MATRVKDLVTPVRQVMLQTIKARFPDAHIDRWLHIQYTHEGRRYRYKFQANTVRHERRHEGLKEWLRVRTLSIKKIAEAHDVQ